jgi:hypothetical protein
MNNRLHSAPPEPEVELADHSDYFLTTFFLKGNEQQNISSKFQTFSSPCPRLSLFFSLRENEAEFFESIVVKTHHSLFYSIYSNLFLIFLKEKEDYLLFFRPLKLNHFSTNRTTLGHLLPFDSNVAPSIFSRLPTLTTYPPSPLKILDNICAASSPPIQIKTGGHGCP